METYMVDNTLVMKQIKQWTPIMRKWASQYENNIASAEDLFNEGVIGIIESIKRFDQDRKVSLSTFLYRCISNAIKSAAINSSFAVSVPSGSVRLIKDQYKLRGTHIQEYDDIHSKEMPEGLEIDIFEIIKKHDRDNIAHMYFIDGVNYKDIAIQTGFSLATISRIINKIRDIIKEKIINV